MMVYQHIFIFLFLLWSFCNGSTNTQTSTTCTLESVTDDLNYLIRHTNAVLKCAEEVIRQMPNATEEDPSCRELPILTGTKIHDCINCYSHAQLRQVDLKAFAQISITKEYWKTAGSPSINYKFNEDLAYKTCLLNDNCILNAINDYTNLPKPKDCNKDGKIGCKDRFWIHLYGEKCPIAKNAFNYGYTNRLASCQSV